MPTVISPPLFPLSGSKLCIPIYLEPADLLTVEVLYTEVMGKNTLVLIIRVCLYNKIKPLEIWSIIMYVLPADCSLWQLCWYSVRKCFGRMVFLKWFIIIILTLVTSAIFWMSTVAQLNIVRLIQSQSYTDYYGGKKWGWKTILVWLRS